MISIYLLWHPLVFLVNLSKRFKQGQNLHLIDDVTEVITKVKYSDNHYSWYQILDILVNIPNESISDNTLTTILENLNSSNMLLSFLRFHIPQNILPKFFSDSASQEDITKGDILVKKIFQAYYYQQEPDSSPNDVFQIDDEPKSNRDINYEITNDDFLQLVAHFASINTISFIIHKFKTHLYKEQYPIHYEPKNTTSKLLIRSNETQLILSFGENSTKIIDFHHYLHKDLKKQLANKVKELGLDLSQIEAEEYNCKLNYWTSHLIDGFDANIGYLSLSKLQNHRGYNSDMETQKLIIVKVLFERIKYYPQECLDIIQRFLTDKNYHHQYFRRIGIYFIGQHWEIARPLFWSLSESELYHLFWNEHYHDDLFKMLENIQDNLTQDELSRLDNLIHYKLDINDEYHKLRLYSGLRNTDRFKDAYDDLSKKLNQTYEDFENQGFQVYSSPWVSQIPETEFTDKSIGGIVSYLKNFKPEQASSEHGEEAVASTLGAVVSSNPDRFINEINLFIGTKPRYIVKLVSGIHNAWRENKNVNVDKLLTFIQNYIQINEYEMKSIDFVIREVAEFIHDIMKDEDDTSLFLFNKALIKNLLILLTNKLQDDNHEFQNQDTVFNLINSTSYKILNALLLYAYYDYESEKKQEIDEVKWSEEIRETFEASLERIIYAYGILGSSLNLLFHLDKGWLYNKVEELIAVDTPKWAMFFACSLWKNPMADKKLYEILHFHYKRTIEENQLNAVSYIHNDNAFVWHLNHFYAFWDYDTFDDSGLILLFLNKAESKMIKELIQTVTRNKQDYHEYFKNDTVQIADFENRIITLWQYIANKFQNTNNENDISVLNTALNFMDLMPKITEAYTNLILVSSPYAQYHETHTIVRNLMRLHSEGDAVEISQHIGKILHSMPYDNRLEMDENDLKILVTFLYKNNQHDIANKVCDKITKKGYNFLLDIYNRYNEL